MFGTSQVIDTIVKIFLTIALAVVLIALLPASPFRGLIADITPIVSPYIGYLNWVFPVGRCLTVLVAWATCIGIYYGIAWILRQLDIVSK